VCFIDFNAGGFMDREVSGLVFAVAVMDDFATSAAEKVSYDAALCAMGDRRSDIDGSHSGSEVRLPRLGRLGSKGEENSIGRD
jgi:hypothetical protein